MKIISRITLRRSFEVLFKICIFLQWLTSKCQHKYHTTHFLKCRARSTVPRRVMDQAVKDMRDLGIHQMELIGQTVQIPNHREIEIDRINQKAPICKKFVRRREKIETTSHQGINIQVNCHITDHPFH